MNLTEKQLRAYHAIRSLIFSFLADGGKCEYMYTNEYNNKSLIFTAKDAGEAYLWFCDASLHSHFMKNGEEYNIFFYKNGDIKMEKI